MNKSYKDYFIDKRMPRRLKDQVRKELEMEPFTVAHNVMLSLSYLSIIRLRIARRPWPLNFPPDSHGINRRSFHLSIHVDVASDVSLMCEKSPVAYIAIKEE